MAQWSAKIEGYVLSYRINIFAIQTDPTSVAKPISIIVIVFQIMAENSEPVMALQWTTNAFALAKENSTLLLHNSQEVCNADSFHKVHSTSARTVLQMHVIWSYGSVDSVERSNIARTQYLM